MKAILLAGGYGTRLFPLTLRTPKPLLPVAGRPVLEYTIELLAEAKILDVVISLKENQGKIEKYFGNELAGAKISYVYEPESTEEGKLGSVGAINYVLGKLKDIDEALVIGGDNFIVGLNLGDFARVRREKGAHASIALFELHTDTELQQSGVAQLDSKGRIIKFQEKPHPSKALSRLASTAIYALDRAFIKEHLPNYADIKRKKGEKADRIGDLWEHFVSDLHLHGHPFEGIWGDIGNCEVYIKTNREAFEHLAKATPGGINRISPSAKVHKGATLIPPIVIDENCLVNDGAIIGPNAHLLHDTVVASNAVISNSIIFERCSIGEQCKIENSIVDGKCAIGADVTITDYSVIGFDSKIGKGSSVTGSKVFPGISVKPGSTVRGDLKNDLTPSSKGLVDSCYWR